jgi:hypothetical protein
MRTSKYSVWQCLSVLLVTTYLLMLPACGVVTVAGAVVGAAVSVTGAVVSTGIKVTGKVVEKTIDAVTPDSERCQEGSQCRHD